MCVVAVVHEQEILAEPYSSHHRHESKDHADMFCTETTFGFRTGVEQRGHDRRVKHLRRLCFCVPVADGLLCPHLIVSIVREDWRARIWRAKLRKLELVARKFEGACGAMALFFFHAPPHPGLVEGSVILCLAACAKSKFRLRRILVALQKHWCVEDSGHTTLTIDLWP